jgi:hypothetical protein
VKGAGASNQPCVKKGSVQGTRANSTPGCVGQGTEHGVSARVACNIASNINTESTDKTRQEVGEVQAGERTVHGKRPRTNEEVQHNEDRTHAPHLRQARQQDTKGLTNDITHQQCTIRDHNTSTSQGVAQRQVGEMEGEQKSSRGEDESSTAALVNEQRMEGRQCLRRQSGPLR